MKYLFLFCTIAFLSSCSQGKKSQITYDVGQIQTPMGDMLFKLSDLTPNHKASFIKLANEHYWDTLTFNRVIKDFVIQGGCPDTPEGFSKSPYLIKPEFHDSLRHVYGAVGIGRDDNPEKLSAGCQFYIVHNKEGIPRLDGNFVIIGQVFKGLEVLDAIGNVATDTLDTPLVPVTLKVNVVKMNQVLIEQNK
ncbi:MAG: peptidylprolyl isomerase [Saprospiraceae bacterium]|jgi:peptidyl-prolyl cis-trans isomerase B (cyclophilin B)|nr:peptidylprolyl isomerase [Saprospiraceae bacterium]